MEALTNPKVQTHHLQRPAYVYIRQSTMGQVRNHQESTERQYALKGRALEMQWQADQIRVLDRDLGQSGAQSTKREDFKVLMADVSMGNVGAVFALEASRLARSNLDWHRLIEICGLTKTLVVDEDGCYDPAEFNDALLLGLKATIAQAELHFIRARLQGAKLNKAKKGELRYPLPVGLCHDEAGQIVVDPDQEVAGAIRLVFETFREGGSAYAVVQHFAGEGLRFPKRSYGGVWDGKLIWGRLTHARVLGVLKNPSYAGVYTWGRYQSAKQIGTDGEVCTGVKRVPMDKWHVLLQDHHPGFISWQEYQRNQEILERNRTNGEETLLSGAAREGLALLQGLLVCARCGWRLSVRYKGNGGVYPMYECNHLRADGQLTHCCVAVRADLLDRAISQRVLELLRPAQTQVATEVLQQLRQRDSVILHQWQMRVERAEYEAQLAQRRYEEVDPSNRLVAGTLEKRWNDALAALFQLRTEYSEVSNRESLVATDEQRAQVAAIARDFPRLWNAASTKAKDKKRLLRLLLKDATVERDTDRCVVILRTRWQGGATEELRVMLPPKAYDRDRYPEDVVQRVRELAVELNDPGIVAALNREGRHPSKGDVFTRAMVSWIRYKHRIPAPTLKKPEELTVDDVVARFHVSRYVVYYWIERGVIDARQQKDGSPYWIAISPEKEKELQVWVDNSKRIPAKKSVS
jgi:DNA invertase Pin-like site-specific DNA recombinase